jgi:hypothetical protein
VLFTAEVQPASIKARAAADRARYSSMSKSGTPAVVSAERPDELAKLIWEAVRAERISTASKADEEVARAELNLLKATPEMKPEAQKKLDAAKTASQAARTAIDALGSRDTASLASVEPATGKANDLSKVAYTSLRGSLKTLENNLETEDSRSKPFPASSTGRRSAFARWITDPKHPLPARVAVNHLWSRHFGKALVPTLFDFGRKGTPPSHPELLDWLAVEFVEQGWSMKHIHRLIVTSNTYRLSASSAGVSPETLTADPDNRFYWRANSSRMEAQVVRDSLLSLAGELDLTLGGPSIPVNNEGSRRRSLYFVHSHNEHQTFLSMFDDASVLECYRRSDSIVPQQALALENSPLATSMAEKITQRIMTANTNATDKDFIRAAFLTVLSAEPSEAEQATVIDAMERLTAAARSKNRPNPQLDVRTNLVHALLNHNDFVTIR